MEFGLERRRANLEERFVFWVKFAETWKALADLSKDEARDEFLANSRTCLSRAALVRKKIENLRTTDIPADNSPIQILEGGPGEAA